ncbi:MAG: glycerol-3-phosphate 1-O-acyltransferase PlsY, partial [Bacteroidota bacterium]
MLTLVLTAIAAYLLGSFNAAYWLGRWFKGIDVREHGSKNAGATNLLRVAGWKLALPAFFIDIGKAFVATSLAVLQTIWLPDGEMFIVWQISLGMLAVIGHLFPVYIGFRGGKGVASLLGVVLAIHAPAALCALAVFVLVLISTRIVSISSVSAGLSFPVFIIFLFGESQIVLLSFSVIAAILLLITHKRNLKRLLSGQEKRIRFK